MALKTVFEYCFNAIEFYPKSNRFVLASRRKSNHFVLKIRLGGFADYSNERPSFYILFIFLQFIYPEPRI